MIYVKSLGIWFLLTISAILVATFRVKILQPPLGEQSAHQIGTILFLIVQFAIIYYFIKKMKIKETKVLLRIGFFWFIITIIFEFVFGHFVMGHSWQKLLADYNFLNGRLWVFVLLNNIAAPLISGKIIK